MNPLTAFLVFVCIAAGLGATYWNNIHIGFAFFAAAVVIAMSLNMANVWQKFVILRLGKLQSVKGAGVFFIIPIIDRIVAIIDTRIQTTAFNAEQALTRDTVPVNVDAIIFWNVQDADEQLKIEIGRKTAPWGVTVSSVEIRDVAIPVALQDAMSRQAQAEREKQARVILGSAEAVVASKFVEAAAMYEGHPIALQLRAMNIIYETTKERGATILMPSSMVESLNPASAALALALSGRASG